MPLSPQPLPNADEPGVKRHWLFKVVASALGPDHAAALAEAKEESRESVRQAQAQQIERVVVHIETNFFARGKLSTRFIRDLHKLMTAAPRWKRNAKGQLIAVMIPGQYKTDSNYAINQISGETKIFAQPNAVPALMEKLINNYNIAINNTNNDKLFDFIILFLIEFLHIHPFGDKNGLVCYALTDLILLYCNNAPLYLNEFRQPFKSEFSHMISKCQSSNNIEHLKNFIQNHLSDKPMQRELA